MKKGILLIFFIYSVSIKAEYGTLGIGGGAGIINSKFENSGFARIAYNNKFSNFLAFEAVFNYSGAAFLESFDNQISEADFNYEADFSSSAYTFILAPELLFPLNNELFTVFIKPQIGISIVNAISTLYKVGNISAANFDEDDEWVGSGRVRDYIAESDDDVDLHFGAEAGIKVQVGQHYSVSLFAGYSNLDFSDSANKIIRDNEAWSQIQDVKKANIITIGLSVCADIGGIIAE